MLYTTPNLDYIPGQPLTFAQARVGLFRTREGARAASPGRPTLAVAVRFDAIRGQVHGLPPADHALGGPWSAPAILDDSGGVVVFAPIPAPLVRVIGPASIRMHPGHADRARGARRLVFMGSGEASIRQRKSSALTPK